MGSVNKSKLRCVTPLRQPETRVAPLVEGAAWPVERESLYGDSVKSTPTTASEAITATLSTWAGWNPVAPAATV